MMLVAGPVFARFVKNIKSNPLEAFYDRRELSDEEMPGFGISLFTALFPIILMISASVVNQYADGESLVFMIINFAGDPTMAMVLAVLLAIYTLGIHQKKKISDITDSLVEGVKSIALILLIIGGAGALKQILTDSGTNAYSNPGLGNGGRYTYLHRLGYGSRTDHGGYNRPTGQPDGCRSGSDGAGRGFGKHHIFPCE